ncbi:hypothetical protein ACO1IE_03220, partial [Mycoplasmopsis bovis]
MKSKFLMTLPALISLPIISATCTNVNQNNSASETKKPNANNKSQNDKIIVHNGSTNEDDNKINNDQSKPGQNNGTNTNNNNTPMPNENATPSPNSNKDDSNSQDNEQNKQMLTKLEKELTD